MIQRSFEQHLKYVIRRTFGQSAPDFFSWTEQKIEGLKSIVDFPRLEEGFVVEAKQVFLENVPEIEIEDYFLDVFRVVVLARVDEKPYCYRGI